MYRPPSGDPEIAFNLITETVKKIKLDVSRPSIILLGDFNIDCSTNKGPSRQISLLNSFSINNGLPQYIDRPTGFGPTSSSNIVLIFTDSQHVSYHGTLACYVSDHVPTFLVIKKHKETYVKTSFVGRSYRNYHKDELHELLNLHNWGSYYASFDVNTAWDHLFSVIHKLANKLCPIKTFYIKRNRPPWFNDEITELSKNQDKFFRTGRRHND